MQAASYAVLDDALERLSPYGIALANGNFNHAPMVVEALCALDRSAAVMPWIDGYRNRLLPRAAEGGPIDRTDWRAALGRRDSLTGWSALFAAELREAPWRVVLDRWAGRLAPGFPAAAAHGVIRVGHAARGLAESETRVRLRELADALASWAASYSELPAARSDRPRRSPRDALASLAIVPVAERRSGNITATLNRLVEFPAFAPAIDLIDVDGDIDALAAELSELLTRIYLANAIDIRTFICFVHGVTGVHALANIAPHVGAAPARSLARYAWQTACALYIAFGRGTVFAERVETGEEDAQILIDRAVANGDEHAIKFTEACFSRHIVAPSPLYLAAIRHAIGIVGGR
jgi:hypothetical protein